MGLFENSRQTDLFVIRGSKTRSLRIMLERVEGWEISMSKAL